MRTLLTYSMALMLAAFLAVGFGAKAQAFSHGSSPVEDAKFHAYQFISGLAIHGEHPMWKMVMPDVMKAAETFSADSDVKAWLDRLNANMARYDGVSGAAFSDTTLWEHYNIVHPMHDDISNLARMLLLTKPHSAIVQDMAVSLRVLSGMYRDEAICGYTVAGGAVGVPDGADPIVYAVDANAAMWQTVKEIAEEADLARAGHRNLRWDDLSTPEQQEMLGGAAALLLLIAAAGMIWRRRKMAA